MLNCKQACALYSESLDRKLTIAERGKLYLHLALCAHCRRYRKQMLFIRQNIGNWQRKRDQE
ncbi:zf-HC2 domain-containing protein [Neisseria sp. Dent CA1/247]|uniref:Putative zinc-finger domain-containing protein n=1 Tax=Neisseria zoodegmatis TaxID=326523 RepID=A0AB38DUF9_9NEIS|nr:MULTISPECIES: zf-HC2 domain-containing protein [Neisseria]MDO5070291.1 zf-HC2 domain-containing protein [Neisseria zoodegmatis]OSI11141.1 hypothetical protein BWD10_01635 [Neisseria zoodegmatis]UOO77522.1 zf-HC2 domain-containing protein [Neisseria sp. Dent CA1/247]SNU80577.1 Uncharacterised protein [Neisseria zoodegmatis]